MISSHFVRCHVVVPPILYLVLVSKVIPLHKFGLTGCWLFTLCKSILSFCLLLIVLQLGGKK